MATIISIVVVYLFFWLLFKALKFIFFGSYEEISEASCKAEEVKGNVDGTISLQTANSKSLTFRNCSKEHVEMLQTLLDKELSHEWCEYQITELLIESNIICLELDKFIYDLRSQIRISVEEMKSASLEWKQASINDKNDLEKEFQNRSLVNLEHKFSEDWIMEALVFNEPVDLTIDDKLLSLFEGNFDLYRFYISKIGGVVKAKRIPADDNQRNYWEYLNKIGLAKRGKEVDLNLVLDNLKMKDINELFGNRIEKKFTKKAAAIEFAIKQPDVYEVLDQHLSFREIFQITCPEDIDVTEIKKAYKYASAQAKVLKNIYVTSYRTSEMLAYIEKHDYDQTEISVRDCCVGHFTRSEGSFHESNPPFHIGCNCSLNIKR